MPFDVYPVKPDAPHMHLHTAEDIAAKINFAEKHGGKLLTSIVVYSDARPPQPATFLVFEYEGEPPADLPWENSATPEQIREATGRALRGH